MIMMCQCQVHCFHVFTVAGVSVFVCLLPSLYESSSKPNIMILRLDEIMARGAKHNKQRNRGSQKSTIIIKKGTMQQRTH